MAGAKTPLSRTAAMARRMSLRISSARKPGLKLRSSMRFAWFSSTKDRAEPPSSAWRISAGSSPALRPMVSASAAACMAATMMSWLADLQICPDPAGPSSVTVLPTASNTARAAEKPASAPPTMQVSVPSIAPCGPPETGLSSSTTPRSAMRRAKSAEAAAAMVEKSITTVPGAAPCTTPSSPNSTFSTSGVSGTHRHTQAAPSAASCAVGAHCAPAASSDSALARLRVLTLSAKPAFMMLAAIAAPMTPRPMKATRAGGRIGVMACPQRVGVGGLVE